MMFRIATGIALLAFMLVGAPVVFVTTRRPDLPGVFVPYALAFVGIAVWTVSDFKRLRRTQGRAAPEIAPGLDSAWDRADEAQGDLAPWLSGQMGPFGGAIQGEALLTGLVRRTSAVPLTPAQSSAIGAMEQAAIATGLYARPALYMSPGGGANAAIAGTVESSLVVVGEQLLSVLDEGQLVAVFADLLVRLDPGTVRGLQSWDPPGVLAQRWRITPETALAVYGAADAKVVLALRDHERLVSALHATATADPYFAGLTVDQAHLLWTWPSTYAPVSLQSGSLTEWVGDAVAAASGSMPRVEMMRIDRLER